MEIQEAIQQRHSVRSFSSKPVSDEILQKLISAGCQAPSASNLQAWRFILINDPALVRKIDLFSPGMSGKPSAIIAIATDLSEVSIRGSQNSLTYGCIMDAAMAAENIMLLAVDLGLGSCAIKSYNEIAVHKILNLPSHFRLELLISLGYPEGESRKPPRKELNQIMIKNRWEGNHNE